MTLKQTILTILLPFLFASLCYGQDRIILQHITKEKKQRPLSLTKDYSFITANGKSYGKIVSFNDTSLTLKTYLHDSIIVIPYNNILAIKKNWLEMNWLKSNDLTYIYALTIFMEGLALISIPIVWIIKGGKAALEVLKVVGVAVGISGTILLPGLLKTKYDLVDKWKIKTINE